MFQELSISSHKLRAKGNWKLHYVDVFKKIKYEPLKKIYHTWYIYFSKCEVIPKKHDVFLYLQ